ncbi:MAG TPA: hypothetical protein VFG49_03675 [Dyella sp.]|uniref:hypothetical protein n=1 Tax=Dyella sp. TaxID=1869338 RepID=UPI002D79280B|nr:hypothetical protein [Dyella sp.]HET6552614.1 hypothetical protein [Dyella sp.]
MLPSWQDNSAKHATAILAEHQRSAGHGGQAGLMGGHARAAHFLFWRQPNLRVSVTLNACSRCELDAGSSTQLSHYRFGRKDPPHEAQSTYNWYWLMA